MKGYFDDLCASKESHLYGAPDAAEDDNERVRELRRALKDGPDDGELYMKRGGRYLTTLQLKRAYADFTRCGSFGKNAQIELLSGLTTYLLRKYGEAKAHFNNWISLAGDDSEELVAVIYWYILCCVKDRDNEGMRDMLARYSPDMHIGHHTAYQCGIRLFLGEITTDEAMKTAEAANGEDCDLEYGMIVYAVANYEYMRGNAEGYMKFLDMVLLRDTFWAGFASIAALNDRHPEAAENAVKRGDTAAAAAALDSFFVKNSKAALAFSGGTDSSLVLYAAKKAGCDIRPYFVKSQFQPQFELDDAQSLCGQLGIRLTVLPLDALSDPVVASNPPDRCYHCKKHVFELIIKTAARDGYSLVIDGTNASDDEGDRPGMLVLREFSVRSPLAECKITKAQVREISRGYDLFTADKPAYACLATRIPTGRPIMDELLACVESAEGALFAMGFTDFRIRVLGDAALLQMPKMQLERAFEKREQIKAVLKDEFSSVLLDLTAR